MSFKYNEHITVPDNMPENCKKILGIWSHKQTCANDTIIWATKENETVGWALVKTATYIGTGWNINKRSEIKRLIDDGVVPDIYNPGTIKSKERYRIVDKGSYYAMELVE